MAVVRLQSATTTLELETVGTTDAHDTKAAGPATAQTSDRKNDGRLWKSMRLR